MTYEIADRARRRTQRVFVAVVAVSAVLLAGFLVLIGSGSAADTTQAQPSSASTVIRGGVARPVSTQQTSDVVFRDSLAGIVLPYSESLGPRIRTGAGANLVFDPSRHGAAFAALHLFVRTQWSIGPDIAYSVLFKQLAPGGDAGGKMRAYFGTAYDELRRNAGMTTFGPPLPSATQDEFVGYHIDTYDGNNATVQILVRPHNGDPVKEFVSWRVKIQWSVEDGTWLLVPPPAGRWSSESTVVGAKQLGYLPEGYRPFDVPPDPTAGAL